MSFASPRERGRGRRETPTNPNQANGGKHEHHHPLNRKNTTRHDNLRRKEEKSLSPRRNPMLGSFGARARCAAAPGDLTGGDIVHSIRSRPLCVPQVVRPPARPSVPGMPQCRNWNETFRVPFTLTSRPKRPHICSGGITRERRAV